MEKHSFQPDLFLVMNAKEMDEALCYAEEMIGENEKCVEMYMNFSIENDSGQYKLLVQNQDVRDYLKDGLNQYQFEFPMIPYYCVLFFEVGGKTDCLALAIPISVWPEAYDPNYLKTFFTKHHFKIKDFMYKPLLNQFLSSTIESEYEQAKIKQIDSPWTIRDKDTLLGALTPGGEASAISSLEEISEIVVLKNVHITLDFNAMAIVSNRFQTMKIDYSTFHFPNALILYTNKGKKTPIYVGLDVSYEAMMTLLKEMGLIGLVKAKDLNEHLENLEEVIIELMPFARFQEKEQRSI